MSSSSHTTPTKPGLVKTFETPHGRRTHIQRLPPVQEGSNDSLDSSGGGVPLNTFAFPGLPSQSKSETNSPLSDRSSSINQASHLSEPAGLQSSLQNARFNMGLQQLEASAQRNYGQLNPSTAEFQPAGIQQAPVVYAQQSSMGVTQGQSNMAMGSTAFQPQAGDQLDGAALTPFTTVSVPSQTGNTFPSQVGSAQLQPQQYANNTKMDFSAPHGSGPQSFNNDGQNTGAHYGQVAQGMSSISSPPANGMANDASGMTTVANAFEQMSMSTLQAHLVHGGQYAQAQTNATPTFPQGVASPAQYSAQSTPFQPQSNVVMQQQQQVGNLSSNSGGGPNYVQSTPAPPSTMYNSPGGAVPQARYVAPPSSRGWSEPRKLDTRPNISNEPPPRFDLQTTPTGVSQQGYSNVMSPASTAGTIPPRGTTASTGPSSSANSVVDPFNGPPLPSVIQPIEPQSAMVLHENRVPEAIRRMRSKQLNALTDSGPNGRPRLDVALDAANFPFVESARNAQPGAHCGVIKLKNIPFATKKSEILAFLGRNSKVLNDSQEPVHIIMERVTTKTNDAFVEFMSMQAASNAVEKHHKTIANGRLSRLGDRPIEVELSSQAALMKDLFPHAKGVRWEGAVPIILEDHPTEPWNCFKGFVTEEEMAMLVKHVEVPQRSPYSRDCPQRPFECMISTLRKLPWYKTDCITIKQRHAVYNACIQLIRLLQHSINDRKNEEHLTPQLLKRLWTSAMLCHGFTVTQRDDIAYVAGIPENRLREFNMPRFAEKWVHAYTLCPKPGTPLDMIEWYIAIIREETNRTVSILQPNIQAQIYKEGEHTDLYWGFYFKELNLPQGPDFDNMTLASMAELEFRCLTSILTRAFG
ncbi:hypothetical protein KVR01_009146 [Diaporthe batatas]|uniref:uncharacterized protein n=1 Tax=Diaporthe batatas TaxID=748121 RepID=UPI001D03B27C|nr:uncharacterized protein KVR01_009146 [Diaporthe batatas]KAG8160882.1 hypothetical protein KVR01_009146 [Diaporthe batatas]